MTAYLKLNTAGCRHEIVDGLSLLFVTRPPSGAACGIHVHHAVVCDFTEHVTYAILHNIGSSSSLATLLTTFQGFTETYSPTRSKAQLILFPDAIWVLYWDQTISHLNVIRDRLHCFTKDMHDPEYQSTKLFSPLLKFLTSTLSKKGTWKKKKIRFT